MLLKTIVVSAAFATAAIAAPPAIGLVTASGHFTLDHSRVWGNATLFEGGKIDTADASSEAALNNGVRVQLGSASSASLSEHRLQLWKGVGQVAASESFEVDAAGFAIRSTGNTGRVRVNLVDGKVDVTTLAGVTKIVNVGTGEMLASLAAGQRRTFALQVGGGTVTRTGCLVFKDNRYLIQDQDTQEIDEVTGNNLAANVGNRIAATGSLLTNARPGVAPATAVLNATAIVLQQQGGCLSVASALNAQTNAGTQAAAPQQAAARPAQPAPTATSSPATAPSKPAAPAATASKGGMSTGAKVGIGVAVAGGGAGAAIALSGGKKSTSP
ncbi:MAG: hypothetical protein ABL967_09790 [Bryobacteraceae bacterium]